MWQIFIRLFLVPVAVVLFCSPALADTKNGGAGLSDNGKIAYVDFNRALNEVSDGKKAKQRLKSEFEEKQQQLDRLRAELKKDKNSIEHDRLLLSEDALEKRESEYRRKFSELEQRLEVFKKEMSEKESEFTREILGHLKTIVKDIGKEEGYSLILEKSQDVVLYAPEGNDLTDRVIKTYDSGGRGKRK